MPRGGSKPGERRGGRKAGTPNKTTLQQANEIRQEAKRTGKALAVDMLSDCMHHLWNIAAKYGPNKVTSNEEKFVDHMRAVAAVAKDLAQYQTPKLASIMQTEAPLDLTKLSDEELAQLERLHTKATVIPATGDQGGESPTQH